MTGLNPLSGLEATVGSELFQKIQQSKILLVGAGGIGCELLKNLALSGFRHVEVIDLDTIDVSNLNRQFLFRSQHVGMPKCQVACEVALKMMMNDDEDSDNKYIPHHGNVCDNSKFNVQYVSQFNLVLNALDNVTARRRVNRLCLAASVPLVEAGTTGYLGQVTVIDKASGTECYECQPKPTQKVYPICTIRSTPSMPVHTIVWAKELYKLLFGPKVEESMLFEDPHGEEHSTYMEAVMQYRSMLSQDTKTTTDDDFSKICLAAAKILTTLYLEEIEKQIDTGRYKTAKKTPAPLSTQWIVQGCEPSKTTPPTKTAGYKPTQEWSGMECVAEFTSCLLDAASNRSQLLPEFDKDDVLSMRFVTAASNLRSYVFGIEPIQSYYSAKGIAGNIIPAIATTNAIVAGLQVLQVFHILKAQVDAKANHKDDDPSINLRDTCRYIYCNRGKTRKGVYLLPTRLPEPNPKCFVCRNAIIPLTLNVTKWDLGSFVTEIFKKELGFEEPTIMLEGDIIYEEGEGADTAAFEQNLAKMLMDLPCGGIRHGTVVRVEDFSQDLEVDVCVTHKETWESEADDGEEENGNEKKYVVGGEKPVASEGKAKVAASAAETKVEAEEDDDDDQVEIIEEESAEKLSARITEDGDDKIDIIEEVRVGKPLAKENRPENGNVSGTSKRPLNSDEEGSQPTKKRKLDSNSNGVNATVEVIEID